MEPPPWLPMGLALEECEAKALAQSRQHCVAERKRRERINSHLSALRSMLPGTAQSDKASLLSAAVKALRDLEGEAAALAEQGVLIPSDVDELDVQELSAADVAGAGRDGASDAAPPASKKAKVDPGEGAAPQGEEAALQGEEAARQGGRATPQGEEEQDEDGTGTPEADCSTQAGDSEPAPDAKAGASTPEPSGSLEAPGTQASEPSGSLEADVHEADVAGAIGDAFIPKANSPRPGPREGSGGGLIKVRVSTEDKLELLPSFKKTIQLLKLELVKLDTASCWNRVTHELLLARPEAPGGASAPGAEGQASPGKRPRGSKDEAPGGALQAESLAPGSLSCRGAEGVSHADGKGGRKGAEVGPSVEVIHAAFKASIERVKARVASGAS